MGGKQPVLIHGTHLHSDKLCFYSNLFLLVMEKLFVLFVICACNGAPFTGFKKGYLDVVKDYKGNDVVEIKYEEHLQDQNLAEIKHENRLQNTVVKNNQEEIEVEKIDEHKNQVCGPIGEHEQCCPNYRYVYVGKLQNICVEKCLLNRKTCTVDIVKECYDHDYAVVPLDDRCTRQTEWGFKTRRSS